MNRSDQPLDTRERRFRLYSLGLGLGSTLVVLSQLYPARHEVLRGTGSILVFSLFIGLAWYFSFSIFRRASLSISLDMAYMMTALCVLPRPLPLAVAVVSALFGSALRTRDRQLRHQRFLPMLGLNTGGLVAAALVGQWLSIRLQASWQFAELTWWSVLAIGALFALYNLTNLIVMGTAVLLKGERLSSYLWHYLRYISTVEVFTLPLCLGLALLYATSGVWGFVPLASTILIGSALLKKLNRAQTELSEANEQLQQRSSELSELNEQLQNRSRELRILYTIGREINSSLDPRVVFSQIARYATPILDAPHLFLSLKERGETQPYMEFVARDGEVQLPPERPLGEGFTNWMVETRRPLLVSDITIDRESLTCTPVIVDDSVRSIIAAPLVVQGDAIGILCVESERAHAYTLDHLSLLTTIAVQVAVAIDNARNFQLAIVDHLTQLYMRDFFFRKLGEEQERARRYGSSFAVLMLDLDRFKDVNDRLGHVAGDYFLQRVGDVIRETMRAADVPCRYGGEEFSVLLPETDEEGARSMAERIRAAIGELEISTDGRTMQTTVSVGVACHPADCPDTIRELIERADRALYAAKQSGRDRVIMAEGLTAAPAAEAAARSSGFSL